MIVEKDLDGPLGRSLRLPPERLAVGRCGTRTRTQLPERCVPRRPKAMKSIAVRARWSVTVISHHAHWTTTRTDKRTSTAGRSRRVMAGTTAGTYTVLLRNASTSLGRHSRTFSERSG